MFTLNLSIMCKVKRKFTDRKKRSQNKIYYSKKQKKDLDTNDLPDLVRLRRYGEQVSTETMHNFLRIFSNFRNDVYFWDDADYALQSSI